MRRIVTHGQQKLEKRGVEIGRKMAMIHPFDEQVQRVGQTQGMEKDMGEFRLIDAWILPRQGRCLRLARR